MPENALENSQLTLAIIITINDQSKEGSISAVSTLFCAFICLVSDNNFQFDDHLSKQYEEENILLKSARNSLQFT